MKSLSKTLLILAGACLASGSLFTSFSIQVKPFAIQADKARCLVV